MPPSRQRIWIDPQGAKLVGKLVGTLPFAFGALVARQQQVAARVPPAQPRKTDACIESLPDSQLNLQRGNWVTSFLVGQLLFKPSILEAKEIQALPVRVVDPVI